MASEDVPIQPASSHWYVSDLNLSLQFHNQGLVIISVLVLSVIVLITILFFHFIRQYRELSSSGGGTGNAVGVGVAVPMMNRNNNNNNNNNNKGLDEATINSLPIFLHSSLLSTTASSSSSEEAATLVVGENYNNECSICLALFEENDRVKVIPRCMHVFHSYCVDKWLHNQASCPLCRSNLHSSSTTALQPTAA